MDLLYNSSWQMIKLSSYMQHSFTSIGPAFCHVCNKQTILHRIITKCVQQMQTVSFVLQKESTDDQAGKTL